MRHSFATARIAGFLDSSAGLTTAEVVARRTTYGPNNIVEAGSSGWLDILRNTLGDPMVWFLAGTAVLFAWLGDVTEAVVLGLALIPIAGMDLYLHRRTQATTEGLAGRLASTASVIRDGARREIAATDLVPGDLVIVSEGSPLPADGVVVGGAGLQLDESALTGESFPVRKRVFTGRLVGGAEASVDSESWASAGTKLLTGESKIRIVHTGADTVYGRIVRSAQAGRHARTPLQHAIGSLVTILVAAAAVICVALAVTRYRQGYGVLDALLSAVTLAVAALPEEFPVVFTFFLGVGVYRLGRRQALVRRAVVVENIGRVTCICCDKTGTLTAGRLQLEHPIPARGFDADALFRLAAAASRAEGGDPIDVAVLERGGGVEGERLATFPFTEDRRREVAIVRDGTGRIWAVTKGAPETVFAMTDLDGEDRRAWSDRADELAVTAHKVIACARRELAQWPDAEPEHGYELVGLLGFEDPVRDGVAEAVQQAQAAGIRIIMITGDHPATAAAIAAELGIGASPPRVIEGSALADHLRSSGAAGLQALDVVARAVPAQKLDLVRALQQEGEIVAVTGDGVNDVPALQGADVGIAMGERGTRTAREVASIVLLDDNFRTIVRAISEGRQLFRNLKLSFAYLLILHVPLVLTAAIIPFAGFPLLYLPMHIVWLELIIHPTALLVFQELPAKQRLDRVVRDGQLRFFSAWEWAVIAVVSAILTTVVLWGYQRSFGHHEDVEHARTMALVVLVIASATVTAGLSSLRSRSAVVAVVLTIASAVVLAQIPALAHVLHLRPLHLDDWLGVAATGLLAGAVSAAIPFLRGGKRFAQPNARKGSPDAAVP